MAASQMYNQLDSVSAFDDVVNVDANSQIDSIPVKLAGRVESVDSVFQLPYVHVINKRTGMGVITDSVGIFKTRLLRCDTLIFRCLGFDDFIYTLPDTLLLNVFFVTLTMGPKSYRLREVDIFALTPQHQFKYDFINMPIDESEWPNQDLYIPGVNNPNYRKLRETERQIYPTYYKNSFEFISKRYKRVQSLMALNTLVGQDKMMQASKNKYNMQMLGEFCGYAGDTLFSFYCHLAFTPEYVFNTPEYDLYVEVLKKMPEFEVRIKEDGLPYMFIED